MPKRIVLMTTGTRGDIQPFAALAHGLVNAGYTVRLAAPENYLKEPEASQLGLDPSRFETVRCGSDFHDFLNDPDVQKILSGGFLVRLRASRPLMTKWLGDVINDMAEAAKDGDALIFHPKLSFATDIAEAINAKPMVGAFQPFTPTNTFPFFLFPWRNLGKTLNRATYNLIYLSRAFTAELFNKQRKDRFGLGPRSRFSHPFKMKGKEIPILYGISPSILPRPTDWPSHVHITGYWTRTANKIPDLPADLQTFLDHGAPPVYVGFGSMPVSDPDNMAKMVLSAVEKAGLRAVIAKGWGDLDPAKSGSLPNFVHVVSQASHEHLFSQVCAVVHHGGAGTTTAGLRAGKPTLICPFLVDQPFWGRRVEDLGVGPPQLPPKRWTTDKLAAAFTDLVHNPNYQRNAAHLAEHMRHENGVEQAVKIIRSEIGEP